jgi:phosphoglycolate phosphatase
MNSPFKASVIVFDLDGTLVHSGPDLAVATNRMLAELKLPTFADETIFQWLGNGATKLVERALTGDARGEPDPDLFGQGYKLFTGFYSEALCVKSTLYPHVELVLDKLKSVGFDLACLTNKPEAFTLPMLRTLNLDRYFGQVVAGDTLPKKKPDPMGLYHICRELDVACEAGVMVGDSISDIRAAQAAGIPVVCVSFGYNQGMDLTTAHPDAIIDSFAELPELIETI